jgi:hypothetical protein
VPSFRLLLCCCCWWWSYPCMCCSLMDTARSFACYTPGRFLHLPGEMLNQKKAHMSGKLVGTFSFLHASRGAAVGGQSLTMGPHLAGTLVRSPGRFVTSSVLTGLPCSAFLSMMRQRGQSTALMIHAQHRMMLTPLGLGRSCITYQEAAAALKCTACHLHVAAAVSLSPARPVCC